LTFVNISSGAANRPIAGWATYCSSKAFTKMFFDVLATQTKNNPDIKIKTIDPGVIDTSMQQLIRNANNHDFPEQPIFRQLNEEGKLRKPSDVAEEIIKEINV
jgi:benzil reductase ((S)-benzoin forming)